MAIEVLLTGINGRAVYDATARTALVYYPNGNVDYFYGVQWGDFEAVAASAIPLAAAQTSLTAKYKASSGHR
jgi:hypothetical protein